jgi:hypothetical protein
MKIEKMLQMEQRTPNSPFKYRQPIVIDAGSGSEGRYEQEGASCVYNSAVVSILDYMLRTNKTVLPQLAKLKSKDRCLSAIDDFILRQTGVSLKQVKEMGKEGTGVENHCVAQALTVLSTA